jgi:DnaK suppressor protein
MRCAVADCSPAWAGPYVKPASSEGFLNAVTRRRLAERTQSPCRSSLEISLAAALMQVAASSSNAKAGMILMMKTAKSGIDAAFVEKQRQRLLRLRATLVAAAQAAESEEGDVKAQRTGDALELEDDAQGLDALERDGNLVVRDVERLERVDRALKKIAEGTYGLSDRSGKPIPQERLEAVPEALYTLSEEQVLEGKRS